MSEDSYQTQEDTAVSSFHNQIAYYSPETVVCTISVCSVFTHRSAYARMTLDACDFSSSSIAAHVDIQHTLERNRRGPHMRIMRAGSNRNQTRAPGDKHACKPPTPLLRNAAVLLLLL